MWTAEFADGPVAECATEWHFAGALSERLWLMPYPGSNSARAGEWTIVGVDGAPPDHDNPWPGQVCYQLDHDASRLERPADWSPGEDEGHAVYRLATLTNTPTEGAS